MTLRLAHSLTAPNRPGDTPPAPTLVDYPGYRVLWTPRGTWQVWCEWDTCLYRSPDGWYFLGTPSLGDDDLCAELHPEWSWWDGVFPYCEPGDSKRLRRVAAACFLDTFDFDLAGFPDLAGVSADEMEALRDDGRLRLKQSWTESQEGR